MDQGPRLQRTGTDLAYAGWTPESAVLGGPGSSGSGLVTLRDVDFGPLEPGRGAGALRMSTTSAIRLWDNATNRRSPS